METSGIEQTQQMLLQKLEAEPKNLQEKLDHKEQGLLLGGETHILREEETSALVRELELGSVDVMERDNKSKVTAIRQLQTANSEFEEAIKKKDALLEFSRRKVSELELQIKVKVEENSEYLTKLQNLEKELAKRIEDQQKMQWEMDRSRDLIQTLNSDINSSHGMKGELENKIFRGDQENEQLRQELERLKRELLTLESTLKDGDDQLFTYEKKLENAENNKSAQIAHLKAEVGRLQELQLKTKLEDQLKERDSLQGKIMKLEMTVAKQEGEILALQKNVQDREKQTSARISFLNTQLEDLLKKLSNKENVQLLSDDQLFSFQQILEHGEDEESAEISTLTMQISHLAEELQLIINLENTLQGKISNLETAITGHQQDVTLLREQLEDKERDASAREASSAMDTTRLNEELRNKEEKAQERLIQMENHISEQTKTIADQQRILKQQEDTILQLREDCKQIKGRFLQAAERKMDETAEEFRNNFEAKLRILSQRIRIAEQLHGENKDGFKKIQERCEQEHSGIEKKIKEYSEMISTNKAAITKVYEAADEMTMAIVSLIMKKFEIEEGNFLSRLSNMANEVQATKKWIQSAASQRLLSTVDRVTLSASFDDDKGHDKAWKEREKKLEEQMNKDEESGSSLLRATHELEKKVGELQAVVEEKEAGIMMLRKEKVEAIKQLSMSIDYHHSRCDRLIEVLSRRRTRSR